MEANFKHLEYNKNRTDQGENRKRASSSGRLSPRALFGNLRSKKPFIDDHASTSRSWKPPIKIDPHNCSNNIFPSPYQSDYNSAHSEDVYLPQDHVFNENEPNKNNYIKEHLPFEDDESENESFAGNSEESELYGDYSKQRSVGTIQNRDIQETLLSHDASFHTHVNNNNNPLKMNDSDFNKVNLADVEIELPTRSQELGIYNDCLAPNGPPVTKTKKENTLGTSIHEPLNSQSKSADKVCQGSMRDLENFEPRENDEQNGLFKSTLEYIEEAKNLLAGTSNVANKTESQLDIKPQNMQDVIKTMNMSNNQTMKNDIDDSFDLTVTNSQFLQLERQVTKLTNDEGNFSNNKLINNIEAIKRCSSSLSVQTEWQKTVVKSLIKDVDCLNKAVVNAISSLKSIRRNNPPSK